MCSVDRDGVRALRKGRTASQDGREDLVQNAGPYRLHGSVAHGPGGPMPRTIAPRVAGRVQATLDDKRFVPCMLVPETQGRPPVGGLRRTL